MPINLSGKSFGTDKNKLAFETGSTSSNTNVSSNNEPVSKRSTWIPVPPKYSFDDLILDDKTQEALLDAASVYKYHEKIMDEWGLADRFGDRINYSINLYGESGTGKTMAAHAIAREMNKQVIFVDYAEIESKYVGETAKNIKQLFDTAAKLDAAIIFDEADALLSRRVTDMRSASDVSVNQTRSVLLNILNEYTGVVIFTTNFIQNFDPAFIRRIRYQIKFELPNEELRAKLWRMYIPRRMPADVDIPQMAAKYCNISGSDISNAVFTAALKATRLGSECVSQSYFEAAIEQIILAKEANTEHSSITVTKRVVTEDYVKEQLGDRFPEDKE